MSRRFFGFVAFSILLASPATSQMLDRKTITAEVPRGTSRLVTLQGYLNPRTCEAGPRPVYRDSTPPKLGQLVVEEKTVAAQRGSTGYYQCEGKDAPVVAVTYKAGAQPGSDRFDFYVTKQGWTTLYEVTITVR